MRDLLRTLFPRCSRRMSNNGQMHAVEYGRRARAGAPGCGTGLAVAVPRALRSALADLICSINNILPRFAILIKC